MTATVRPLGLSIKSYTALLMIVSFGAVAAGVTTNFIYARNNPGADPYLRQPSAVEKPILENDHEPIATSSNKDRIITISSDWVGGGNDINSFCFSMLSKVKNENAGKNVSLVRSRQETRKDFLAKVEFKYVCDFAIR